MSRSRSYSDEEKASALAALDANGGDIKRTAKLCNVPIETLRGWSKGQSLNAFVLKVRDQEKRSISEVLEVAAGELADKLLDQIRVDTKSTLVQKATALAILIDKGQLLKGEATQITHNLQLSPEQRKAKIEELRRQLGKAS